MQDHVRKRGKDSWKCIADIGVHAAERCQECGCRFWIERKPRRVCPTCGGRLVEIGERHVRTEGNRTCGTYVLKVSADLVDGGLPEGANVLYLQRGKDFGQPKERLLRGKNTVEYLAI